MGCVLNPNEASVFTRCSNTYSVGGIKLYDMVVAAKLKDGKLKNAKGDMVRTQLFICVCPFLLILFYVGVSRFLVSLASAPQSCCTPSNWSDAVEVWIWRRGGRADA